MSMLPTNRRNLAKCCLVIAGFLVGSATFVAVGARQPADSNGDASNRTPESKAPAPSGRFQMQVWMEPGFDSNGFANQGDHGCYVLDTTTGELWHADARNNVVKVK